MALIVKESTEVLSLPEGARLHKRYEVLEPITAETKFVYGIDRLSRGTPNLPVVIRILSDEAEYKKTVGLFRAHRSAWCANLVDAWIDEDSGQGFIVIERGGLTLVQYIDSRPKAPLSFENGKALLTAALCSWASVRETRGILPFNPRNFMQFGKEWQLVAWRGYRSAEDLASSAEDAALKRENPFYVPPGVAEAIIEGRYNFHRSTANKKYGPATLGTLLLEWLLSLELYKGKTTEQIYSMVQFSDSLRPHLTTSEEKVSLSILKHTLLSVDMKKATLYTAIEKLLTMLPNWKPAVVAKADPLALWKKPSSVPPSQVA